MRPLVLSSIFSAFIAITSTRGAAADVQTTPTSLSLANANNELGFKLLRELAKAEPGKNICISPFSLASVLQIVRNGAVDQTQKELDKVLETGGLRATNLASSYSKLARALGNQSTNCVLEIANAIWFAPNITLDPSFESLTKQFYDAQLSPLDFTDPRAAGMVNSWVSEKTHGRIVQLFQGSLPGSTSALVVNTAYFKGKWTTPFDAARTREHPFHISSGTDKSVRMMENSGHFLYDAGPEAQVLRLPYGDERVGMLIVLPAKDSSPLDFLGHLAATNWAERISARLQKVKGHVVLPLLKLDYQADLKQSLSQLGIHRAFTRSADFSGMAKGSKLFIDQAIQKVSVEVNEEGTTAAAASAIRMRPTAVEIRTFEMVVDRPFVFAICDQQTQTILFLGIVQDPS